MKVSLCVQTLSSSVADSIQFVRQSLRLPQFLESAGTERFIRVIDHLFDIMNVSSPLGHGSKAPVRLTKLQSVISFLDVAEQYITGLTTSDGTSLTSTQRNIGFIGFLVNIKSIRHLIRTKVKRYLCHSKFSVSLVYKYFDFRLKPKRGITS